MSLIKGLIRPSGLLQKNGLLRPLLPAPGFVDPESIFPSTAVGLDAILGATPSSILTFQELSGTIVDSVGVLDMTTQNSPVYAQATDLPDGSVCLRMGGDGASTAITAANTSHYDPGTASWAYLNVIKIKTAPASSRTLTRKFTGGVGYIASASSSALTMLVDDGPTALGASVSPAGGVPVDSWLAIAYVVDRTADFLHIYLSTNESDSEDISTITGTMNSANNRVFGVASDSLDAQLRYEAYFEGVEAEAINQTTLNTFWANTGI